MFLEGRAATASAIQQPLSSPLLSSLLISRLNSDRSVARRARMGIDRRLGHSTKETMPVTSPQVHDHPRLFPLQMASTILVLEQNERYYSIRRVQQP
jgi:hypothetical protein